MDIRNIFNLNSAEMCEKIESILDNLKDIFEHYATIGIKTDIYNMGLSGFLKFSQDCDILINYEQNENNNLNNSSQKNLKQI